MTFQRISNTLVLVLFAEIIVRLYMLADEQFPDRHLLWQLFSSVIVISLVLVLLRGRKPTSFKVKAPDWATFWREFSQMTEELGFMPACQIENHIYFQRGSLGDTDLITLKKFENNLVEVTVPSHLTGKVAKKLSIYRKLLELSPATSK